jgi:hypothetical protein
VAFFGLGVPCMADCAQRNHLVKLWNEAVLAFSQAVGQLKACRKSDQAFAEQHQLTEMARLHADNARSMLELHRTEHGC